jgi:hypothetical protein
MTFEEAIDNAVRAFYEGAGFTEYEKATGEPVRYNKDFFDMTEEDIRPRKTKETSNGVTRR